MRDLPSSAHGLITRRNYPVFLSLASLSLVWSCSPEASPIPLPGPAGAPSTGGAVQSSGGQQTTGGAPSTSSGGAAAGGAQPGGTGGSQLSGGAAGAAAGGATSGGASSGGAQGLGGLSASGGVSGAQAGSGGSSEAGSASTMGGSGNAGASSGGAAGMGNTTPAKPSAGCGKAARPNGGIVTVNGSHIFTFPESYDGTKPFPLLLGLHAAGNPIDQIQKLTNGSPFEKEYVRAFPKSAGNEWVYRTDLNKVQTVFDDLKSNYCIDESRVFATGHSSGAQMIFQILINRDARDRFSFKAVAPVAASNYGSLVGPTAVMYIQGKMDSVRGGSGSDVVARFTAANQCSSTTSPYMGVAGCSSSGTMVNPGCVSYEGCSAPTVWCSHNDPQYSNTNHGWPCFATRAMYDFFAGLR